MSDQREAFVEALTQLRACHARREEAFKLDGPINAGYRAAVEAAYAAKTVFGVPGKKKRGKQVGLNGMLAVLGSEAVDAIHTEWQAKATALYGEIAEEEKGVKARLDELAPQCALEASDAPRLFDTVRASSYSTQGYGADSYARNSAGLSALSVQATGLRAEVVPRVTGCTRAFDVMVYAASDVDLEIVKHRPTLTTREWLRLSWKLGANPRVFNPYLPQGLEEKLGLDYHGNDLKLEEGAVCDACQRGAHAVCGNGQRCGCAKVRHEVQS